MPTYSEQHTSEVDIAAIRDSKQGRIPTLDRLM